MITVVICTWNRAPLLDQALRQMMRLHSPEGDKWELLVVNNNCTDNTEEVVASYEVHLPLRHIFEPKQGLSHARNRAIQEAQGDVILWADDDVLMDENWLMEYAAGIRRHPDATFFGGPVEPWFEVDPPKWIEENMEIFASAFAYRNLGKEERKLMQIQELPFGANMAVRKKAYNGVQYDSALGRIGKVIISGEETQIFKHFLAAGLFGVWLPKARVKHYVSKERLTRKYLSAYYQGYGNVLTRIEHSSEQNLNRISKTTIRLIWSLIRQCLKVVIARVTMRADHAKLWKKLQVQIGQMKEFRC